MNVDAFRKRISDTDVAFVHDDAGNVYDWKLRSLPALQFLGVGEFTYPTSWRQLKHGWEHEKGGQQFGFPGYNYHVLGGIDLSASTDMGVITTSYYERQTQYTISPLVDRYTTSEGTLVVVADDRTFQPDKGARPLYQEPFVTHLGSYDRLYKAIESAYDDAGWDFPLHDTKNRFLQDMANLYEFVEDERLTTTTELFEVLDEAPYLPLYRVFGEIFDQPDAPGTGPLETDDMIDALGGWLRRRIEWDRSTSIEIARTLNRDVATDASAFAPAFAARNPKFAEAASLADNLEPEGSCIDAQYYDWLTETTI